VSVTDTPTAEGSGLYEPVPLHESRFLLQCTLPPHSPYPPSDWFVQSSPVIRSALSLESFRYGAVRHDVFCLIFHKFIASFQMSVNVRNCIQTHKSQWVTGWFSQLNCYRYTRQSADQNTPDLNQSYPGTGISYRPKPDVIDVSAYGHGTNNRASFVKRVHHKKWSNSSRQRLSWEMDRRSANKIGSIPYAHSLFLRLV
jgi:hypothetical protein